MVGKTKIDKLIIQEKNTSYLFLSVKKQPQLKLKKSGEKKLYYKEKRGYLEKFIKFIIIQFNLGILRA